MLGRSMEARRAARALAVGAMLLVASVAAGCGASEGGGSGAANQGEKEGKGGKPAELRVGYQLVPNGGPVVKHRKWLETELGIPVKYVQFDSGANVNRAIASGSVDVGLAGSSPVANGVSQGLPYQVAWIYDVIGDAEALVVKEDGGVSSIADLAGKKVGVPFGSTTHYSMLKALELEGVDAGQVDVIDLEPDDIVAAWQRGDIAGAYVWNPSLAKLKADGGKVLITSEEMAGKGVLTADLGIVRTEFAEQYPDVVAGWLKQEDRAVKLFQSDPEAAAKDVAAEFGIPQDEALAQMKDLILLNAQEQVGPDYLGKPGQPGKLANTLSDTATFLKGVKLVDQAAPLDKFQEVVNPEYASKAAAG